MNITDYLLLPEQAIWAKERGFDGECNFWADSLKTNISVSPTGYSRNSACSNYNYAIPTFSQFFDWVEEKFGMIVSISNFFGEIEMSVDLEMRDKTKRWYKLISEDNFKTKRAARIAAVGAIIKYINENIKDE